MVVKLDVFIFSVKLHMMNNTYRQHFDFKSFQKCGIQVKTIKLLLGSSYMQSVYMFTTGIQFFVHEHDYTIKPHMFFLIYFSRNKPRMSHLIILYKWVNQTYEVLFFISSLTGVTQCIFVTNVEIIPIEIWQKYTL